MTKKELEKMYLRNRVKYLDYPDEIADFGALCDTVNDIKNIIKDRNRAIDIIWEVTNRWR